MKPWNQFSIIGNLARDVTTRQTTGGTSVARYVVAVNEVYYDKDGQRQERCDFFPVTSYGKQAENDAKYLGKGAMVAVSGSLRSWYKAEEQRGGFEFVASGVRYLGKPHSKGEAVPDEEQAGAHQAAMPDDVDAWLADYDAYDPQARRFGN